MQKFKFFTLAIIAMLSVNFVWGEDATLGLWTSKPIAGSNGLNVNGNLNDDMGNSWSVALTGSDKTKNPSQAVFSRTTYWQLGANGNMTTGVFSTSAISGTITQIVVDCAAYHGLGSVNVTVGGNNFGTQGQTMQTWGNPGGGELTFSGSASGAIVVTMAPTSGGRAIYLSSIVVTYTSCEEPTVLTEDGACQTNANLDLEDCFASDNTSAVTFTCTSSNKSSCTISGSTFRATAAGTYEIKATQAKDGTYCAVVETFNVVVTAPTCYVTFLNNGQPISGTGIDDQGRKQYHEGDQLGELPTLDEDDACDATSKHFMGWTSDAGFQKRAAPPSSFVSASTPATDGMILRAVWARAQ